MKVFNAEADPGLREQETKKVRLLLKDKNRWIAAHVFLTWITPGRYKVSDETWAGLKITEGKDGRFFPVEGQQESFAKSWADKE